MPLFSLNKQTHRRSVFPPQFPLSPPFRRPCSSAMLEGGYPFQVPQQLSSFENSLSKLNYLLCTPHTLSTNPPRDTLRLATVSYMAQSPHSPCTPRVLRNSPPQPHGEYIAGLIQHTCPPDPSLPKDFLCSNHFAPVTSSPVRPVPPSTCLRLPQRTPPLGFRAVHFVLLHFPPIRGVSTLRLYQSSPNHATNGCLLPPCFVYESH